MRRSLRTAGSPSPTGRASASPSTARPGPAPASTARFASAFPIFPTHPVVPAAAQVPMRIVDIREAVVPISSPLRNAYIDFSKMTASVVAVVTDVVRDGKPVVGYGFNSNGRYAASGLLRERFLPRLREADPASLVNDAGDRSEEHTSELQPLMRNSYAVFCLKKKKK